MTASGDALDGAGDEVADCDHVLGFEARAGPELNQDARLGGLAFVGEDGVLGEGDVDTGLIDGGNRHDGSFEFAFESAVEVDLFGKVAGAEVGFVEDFKSDPAAFGDSGGGELEAELADLGGRNEDRCAAVADAVGHAGFADLGEDEAGVFGGEVRVERLVIALGLPMDEAVERGESGERGGGDGDLVLEGEGVEEALDLVHAGFLDLHTHDFLISAD